MENRFLIHIDILGFEEIPKKIAKDSGLDEDTVREKFLKDPLVEKIRKLENSISDLNVEHSGTDNFLLTCINLDSLFEVLENLIHISISNKPLDNIPLELVVVYKQMPKKNVDITNQSATIDFWKMDLIKDYKGRTQDSIHQTFLLVNAAVYEQLDQFDKKNCEKIESKDNTYFNVNLNIVSRKQKIRKFLEQIKKPNHTYYGRIDTLFVPPKEFAEIKDTLKHKKIVFITGTKEFGKTYTAIRLLWEFYNLGYFPKWIGGEENEQMQITRDKLTQIENELKPNHVIYFEDPFGRTKYEATEILEREIREIIKSIEQVKDVFVIITSREEVFKEFESEKLSNINLREFERTLNIKKPSYDSASRKKILQIYANYKNCAWLKNLYLRNEIFRQVESNRVLPTPLSIRSFVNNSQNASSAKLINLSLNDSSEETAQSFAKEIRNMDESKKLFLAILFVSRRGMKLSQLEKLYQDLSQELGLKKLLDFQTVLIWFKNDKIEYNEQYISFSHPSYHEALGHVLANTEKHTTSDRDLFAHVLLFMANHNFNLDFVADAITLNYTRFDPQIQNELLKKISATQNDRVKAYLAMCIKENFNKIPNQLRDVLIDHVSSTESAAEILVPILVNNEKSINATLRRTVLLKSCNFHDSVKTLIFYLFYSLDKFAPTLYDEILQYVYRNGSGHQEFSYYIDEHYKKLNKNLKDKFLSRLANSSNYQGEAGKILLSNCKKNEKWQRELFDRLILLEKPSYQIAKYLDIEFEKIPKDMLRKILQQLSKSNNSETIDAICKFLELNFNNIEQDLIITIIQKIKNKPNAPGFLIGTILKHYDTFNQEIKDLVFEFVSNEEYRIGVLFTISQYFVSVPTNIQNLLKRYNEEFFMFLKTYAPKYENRLLALEVLKNIAMSYKNEVKEILDLFDDDLDDEIQNQIKDIKRMIN